MRYRGSKIVPVRIKEDLLEKIQAAIARVEYTRNDGPHTMSSWIIEACLEKLNHQARALEARRRRQKAAQDLRQSSDQQTRPASSS